MGCFLPPVPKLLLRIYVAGTICELTPSFIGLGSLQELDV